MDGDSAAEVESSATVEEAAAPVLQECGYYDVEQVQRLTGLLLFTLAAACVEKTIGDLFNQPSAVVAEFKKELEETLEQQSLSYAAAFSKVSERVQAPRPMKVVQGFLDNFVRSKSNLLGRVSSRILSSDKKEEKIEELVSELDRAGIWMVGRREVFAKTLLRRVDPNMLVHCEMKFTSSEELAEHKGRCILRPTTCTNEGCTDVYSAIQGDSHDMRCLCKRLACEQGCGSVVTRAEMDRHCVTVCPMKLVPCPFQHVGCSDRLPQRTVERHCEGSLSGHLMGLLQAVQRLEVGLDSQSQRIARMEKALAEDEKMDLVEMRQEVKSIKQVEDVLLRDGIPSI